MTDDYSDDHSTDSYVSDDESNDINKFISKHLDQMLDIYDDLKDRFGISNAYFLAWMKGTDFTDFLVSSFFEECYTTSKDSKDLDWFIEEFEKEIDVSFNIIFKFAISVKFEKRLSKHAWSQFCLRSSILE